MIGEIVAAVIGVAVGYAFRGLIGKQVKAEGPTVIADAEKLAEEAKAKL